MQAIPQTEDDLIKVPVYINMKKKQIVDDLIGPKDIDSPMREIYIGDEEAAISSINSLQRNKKWLYGFQFDLLVAFWLGAHYGRVKVLNHLIKYDIYLR